MTTILVDLGYSVFESRKTRLRTKGYCSATFRIGHLERLINHESDTTSADGFLHDCWISRISHLMVTFKLSFTTQPRLSENQKHELVELLEKSIRFARLWSDLGLQPSSEPSGISCDEMNNVFCFSIILQNVVESFRSRQAGEYEPHSSDSTNMRPPVSVPTYKLKSIQIMIEFATLSCGNVRSQARDHDSNLHEYYTRYIQLADATIRRFICQKPMRMIGVRPVVGSCPTPLASIVPSTFSPGYADRLSWRSPLIEPIAKFLSAYSNQRDKRFVETVLPGCRSNSVRSGCDEQTDVKRHLWMTMANALRDEEDARRLSALKYIPGKVAEVSNDKFDYIARNFEDFDEADAYLEYRDGNEYLPNNHCLFDLPIESERYVSNEMRSVSSRWRQQSDTYLESGEPFTHTTAYEAMMDLHFEDDRFQPCMEIEWEDLSTHRAPQTRNSRDSNDTEATASTYPTYATSDMIGQDLSMWSSPSRGQQLECCEDDQETVLNGSDHPEYMVFLDEMDSALDMLDDEQTQVMFNKLTRKEKVQELAGNSTMMV